VRQIGRLSMLMLTGRGSVRLRRFLRVLATDVSALPLFMLITSGTN
jgi:hypothetical protein